MIDVDDRYKIFLDFDGTVVEQHYPGIGRRVKGAFDVIRKLQFSGHQIVLNSYRIDKGGKELTAALQYFTLNPRDFTLPIKEHSKSKVYPSPWDWEVMKLRREIYIDDMATWIPLTDAVMSSGQVVDWLALDKQFKANGLYMSKVEDMMICNQCIGEGYVHTNVHNPISGLQFINKGTCENCTGSGYHFKDGTTLGMEHETSGRWLTEDLIAKGRFDDQP